MTNRLCSECGYPHPWTPTHVMSRRLVRTYRERAEREKGDLAERLTGAADSIERHLNRTPYGKEGLDTWKSGC